MILDKNIVEIKRYDNPRYFFDAMKELMKANRDATNESAMGDVEPSFDYYESIGENLLALGLFKNGTPIGYLTAVIFKSPHYNRMVCAHDSMYIIPEFVGRYTHKLMQHCRDLAKEAGCDLFLWTAKSDSSFERTLMKRYKKEDVVFKEDL